MVYIVTLLFSVQCVLDATSGLKTLGWRCVRRLCCFPRMAVPLPTTKYHSRAKPWDGAKGVVARDLRLSSSNLSPSTKGPNSPLYYSSLVVVASPQHRARTTTMRWASRASPLTRLAARVDVRRFIRFDMVVSLESGTPIWTPIYYNPYSGTPKKVPIILENPIYSSSKMFY